ncbi:hypothetical protein FB451DRAFT_1195262 [Mycena latifolia]|nr:hypothetical protein FB451DRAFT_1195262 [Mycena latifolia]
MRIAYPTAETVNKVLERILFENTPEDGGRRGTEEDGGRRRKKEGRRTKKETSAGREGRGGLDELDAPAIPPIPAERKVRRRVGTAREYSGRSASVLGARIISSVGAMGASRTRVPTELALEAVSIARGAPPNEPTRPEQRTPTGSSRRVRIRMRMHMLPLEEVRTSASSSVGTPASRSARTSAYGCVHAVSSRARTSGCGRGCGDRVAATAVAASAGLKGGIWIWASDAYASCNCGRDAVSAGSKVGIWAGEAEAARGEWDYVTKAQFVERTRHLTLLAPWRPGFNVRAALPSSCSRLLRHCAQAPTLQSANLFSENCPPLTLAWGCDISTPDNHLKPQAFLPIFGVYQLTAIAVLHDELKYPHLEDSDQRFSMSPATATTK